jgi:hypothetical protein
MNQTIKKSLFTFLSIVCIASFSNAQDTDGKSAFESKVMNTDRGTFTRSATTIGKGLQLEAGIGNEWTQSTDPVFKTGVFNPFNGQLRIGLSKLVEFDLAISNNELVMRRWDGSPTDRYNYWTPLEIGLRVQILDKEKSNMAVFTNFRAISTQRDVVDKDGNAQPWVMVARPNYVGPEFAFLSRRKIGKRLEFATNVGIRWTGIVLDGAESAKRPDFYYTVRGLVHLTESFDFYVEHFNYMRNGFFPTLGLNSGFRYALSERFVVDINGGLGLKDVSPELFVGGGLSYRLGK